MNFVHLVGRAVQEPQLRQSDSGKKVANLNLVTLETWQDKGGKRQERTEFHRLVFWDRNADQVVAGVKKGNRLGVDGKIQTRSWRDSQGQQRYTTEIVVGKIYLMTENGDVHEEPA